MTCKTLRWHGVVGRFALRSCIGRAIVFSIISQFVREVETLLEELRHAPLSIRNFIANHEFAVFSHVIDRVQLFTFSKSC